MSGKGAVSEMAVVWFCRLKASVWTYCVRNLIERFFNKIQQCRRVATRYDLAANYLAFIKLASIRIWLRANESTP
jgi:transposase